jgi:hypothetical protein
MFYSSDLFRNQLPYTNSIWALGIFGFCFSLMGFDKLKSEIHMEEQVNSRSGYFEDYNYQI